MSKENTFFIECTEDWRDGFLIPVRNRLGEMIDREFIPIEYKDRYLTEFGETVLYDDVFIEWYCQMSKETSQKH